MVADMLVTTSGWAVGYNNVNGVTFGSKTGTSNYSDEIMEQYNLPYDAVNDLWVAGICRDYATALWYGYDEIDYNHGKGNTQLYSALINGVFTGASGFDRPSSVVSVTVEKDSPGNGLLPSQYTPDGMKITELFKAGTEPTKVSDRFAPLGDVSNLKGSISGNEVHLSWDAIPTPNALNRDYYNGLYAADCKNVGGCVNAVIGANNNILGNVVYKVYVKQSNGQLTQINGNDTTGTTYSGEVPAGVAGRAATFVVKATYQKYDALASGGVEVTVDASGVKFDFDIRIDTTSVTATGSYTDTGVKVYSNSKDVTSSCSITTLVDGKEREGTIKISTPGDHTIEYKVTYKGTTKSATKHVKVN